MSVDSNMHQWSSSSGNDQKHMEAANTFTWLTLPEGPSRIWDKCPVVSKQQLLIAYVTSLKVCLQKDHCMWDELTSISVLIQAWQPSHAVQTSFAHYKAACCFNLHLACLVSSQNPNFTLLVSFAVLTWLLTLLMCL